MHLTESHMHAFNTIPHACIQQNPTCMYLTEIHACILQNHMCMHLTESHVYAFN